MPNTTPTYPDGFFSINDSGQQILIGDLAPDQNETVFNLDDAAGTIRLTAANGVLINGDEVGGSSRVKKYVARLSQTGTTDPVVTAVLENTLGSAVTWERLNPGQFRGTVSNGAFISDDQVVFFGWARGDDNASPAFFLPLCASPNEVRVNVFNPNGSNRDDDFITVEILVYP